MQKQILKKAKNELKTAWRHAMEDAGFYKADEYSGWSAWGDTYSTKCRYLFNANNQTCWNINGAKHCGDFTYEDNKSKIEVKNGSTNITLK